MDFRKNERYFVVCALIMDEFQGCSLGKIVKQIIYEKSKTDKIEELHASQMSQGDKIKFYKSIDSIDYLINYIVLDKDCINKNIFKNKNVCFNYMVYLILLDMINDFNIINLYITIDNRNIECGSEKSLEEYLNIELLKRGFYDKNIKIRYLDSRKDKNLQAVDIFANAIYSKFNFENQCMYECFAHKLFRSFVFPLDVDNFYDID
jgi:disulfide oxidoreductase YuzD